jgi:hypothetical protein
MSVEHVIVMTISKCNVCSEVRLLPNTSIKECVVRLFAIFTEMNYSVSAAGNMFLPNNMFLVILLTLVTVTTLYHNREATNDPLP